MSDDANTGGEVTEPVDLGEMTDTEIRTRESELRSRYDELKAKDKTLAELAELGTVTRELNEAVEAISKFAAPSEDVPEVPAPVVPDTAEAIADDDAVEVTDTAQDDTDTGNVDGDGDDTAAPVVDADLVAATAAAVIEQMNNTAATDPATDPATGLGEVTASVKDTAPIVASAAAQNMESGQTLSMSELGAAMQSAIISGAGRGGQDVIIASVNPYGNKAADDSNALGSDPVANHKILHPDTPDYMSVTAAVGCAPAEPPREIPSCFNADEPVLGTMTEQRVQYGQVQLYDPSCLDPEQTGLMIPGPECGPGCVPSVELECAETECVKPNEPVKVIPVTACVCVADDLQFSAPYVLDDQLNKLNAGFAKGKELWRLGEIRKQSIVKTFTPPYGAAAGVAQFVAQIAALAENNQRCAGGFEDYQLVYHGGDMKTLLADVMNRTWGVTNGLDDVFQGLRDCGVSDFVEIIDFDDVNSTTAAGPRPVVDPTLVGNANVSPLEPLFQTPTFYLYRRDSFLTGSPSSTQLGFGDVEKDELAAGCSKMIMRQYWLPPTFYGCRPAFTVDLDAFCASGSGPDRQTPVCAGSEAGGGGEALP